MPCLRQSALSSAESSTADQSGNKQRQMESWLSLSLSPPGSHVCRICGKRFSSIKALGGHQNAHRGQRESRMQNMQMKILERKRVRSDEDGGGDHHVDPIRDTSQPSTKRARNNTDELPVAENGIDLELSLGRSCPASTMKVMNFYDFFVPIKESKGYGVGAPSGSGVNKINNDDADPHAYTTTTTTTSVAYGQPLQRFEMAVRSGGANEGGGDRFDLKASIAGGGGSGTGKVSNNTGLDVTLKL